MVAQTLAGELQTAPLAEAVLERAYRADPNDRTTARLLGRFLNLRLTEGDYAKAELQAELYARLEAGESSPREAFVFSCFQQATKSADLYGEGKPLRAFWSVRTLEAALRDRVEAHPDDVELAAMAGNYALELAMRIPVGRARRLRQAATHFEHQQEHWDRQSVLTRGIGTAPGTRAVFAFWLGEVQLARGQADRAARAYGTVLEACDTEGATVAVCELAEVANHRLGALDLYSGRSRLLPVWPRGAAACVACHAEDATIEAQDPFLLSQAVGFAGAVD